MRRAKIVATLGPRDIDLREDPGDHRCRTSTSRDEPEPRRATTSTRRDYANVRKASDDAGRAVAVLVDLQGPKIRLGKFADGPHELAVGDIFKITTEDIPGTKEIVGTTFKGLPNDVEAGRLSC